MSGDSSKEQIVLLEVLDDSFCRELGAGALLVVGDPALVGGDDHDGVADGRRAGRGRQRLLRPQLGSLAVGRPLPATPSPTRITFSTPRTPTRVRLTSVAGRPAWTSELRGERSSKDSLIGGWRVGIEDVDAPCVSLVQISGGNPPPGGARSILGGPARAGSGWRVGVRTRRGFAG